MSGDENDYPYELVAFTGCKDEEGRSLVDIVLNSWISFKRNKLIHVTKYPPPPYDRSTLVQLNKCLKTFADAPDYWAEYPIDFKGRARTLEDARIRLNKLKFKEFAYTTDPDFNGADQAAAAEKKHRDAKLKVSQQEEDEVFKVSAPFPFVDVGNPKNSNSRENRSSDDSISSIEKKRNRKRKRRSVPKNPPQEKNSTTTSRSKTGEPEVLLQTSPEPSPKKSKNSEEAICRKKKLEKHIKKIEIGDPLSPGSSGRKGKITIKKDTLNVSSKMTKEPSKEIFNKPPTEKRDEFLQIFRAGITAEEKENPVLLFLKIMKALHVIYLDNKETQRKLRDLEAMLLANGINLDLPRSFADKYELSLPFAELKEFQTFENRLKSDSAFRYEFKQTFNDLMDRTGSLSRTQLNILKNYLARELVILFNAVKKTEQKTLIFKDTEFYKCMLDIITKRYKLDNKVLTEKEFQKTLGPVITNAIDWDGHRALRVKKVNESIDKMMSDDEEKE